eukprot:GHRR01003291.1.p1 GENE.GHRR01003291.1~~GHRR01003291.1.p1  ORF type:complete len:197 (+),score=58.08 GHRR01003291.1:243-833(+)
MSSWFRPLLRGMDASSSKEEGIITVTPSTRKSPAQPAQTSSADESLLHHLRQLQARMPKVDNSMLNTPSPAAADPESLLQAVDLVKQLSSDTQLSNGAITNILTAYQSWHNDNIKAVTTNQEYIARTIDQAETKAQRAVRHVQLQTIKLKAVSTGLAEAAALPVLVAQLTATAASLERQLQQLEQLAGAAAAANRR